MVSAECNLGAIGTLSVTKANSATFWQLHPADFDAHECFWRIQS
jgi:hypothetical protein